MPKVSIVIPVYNGAKNLNETISSVLNQTYQDFELILVDDASTDNSVEVIKKYGNKLILLQHETNKGGPSFTKNTGIKIARGEYCAFVDQDDIWYPTKLADQVALFQECPEIIANFTNGHILNHDTNRNIAQRWSQIEKFPSQEYCIDRLLRQNFILSTTSAVIKTSILKKIGGFDENMLLADDYEMWFNLATKGRLGFIVKPLFQWRYHLTSLSHNEEKHLSDLIYFYQKALKTLPNLDEKYQNFINIKLALYFKRLGNYYLDNNNRQKAFNAYLKSLDYNQHQKLLKFIIATHKISPLAAKKLVSLKRSYSQSIAKIDPEWTLVDNAKEFNKEKK